MNKIHDYRRMEREYISGDMSLRELCRRHGISQNTFYKWKAKFGGMNASDARKLKALVCLKARGSQECWQRSRACWLRSHWPTRRRTVSGQ